MMPLIIFVLNRSYIVVLGILTGYHMGNCLMESTLSTRKCIFQYYLCLGLVRRKTVAILFLEAR
jgi:hypothetical protein